MKIALSAEDRDGGSENCGNRFVVEISKVLRRRVARGGLVAGVALGLCACQPSFSSHGSRRDVSAAYQFRTLEAKLGPEVQVLTVKAAAEQALRSRGYVVTKVSGDNDKCRVVAKSSGGGDWEQMVVEAWAADQPLATKISVTCEPWGDEAVSRSVLDGILTRLGR